MLIICAAQMSACATFPLAMNTGEDDVLLFCYSTVIIWGRTGNTR